MTVWQRVKDIMIGLLMVVLGGIMFWDSEIGFYIVCAIVCLTMFVIGVKSLIYYQTMARHMVGGRMMLYKGVVLFDLGVFTMTLTTIPRIYIILYLMGIHMFAGLVDVLRAMEARKLYAPAWKGSLLFGIGNILLAVLSIGYGFFTKSITPVVDIYSAGLIYTGLVKIISSFKKSAIVYIQ